MSHLHMMDFTRHINQQQVEERKPIWLALSRLYLDTELEESDFTEIALKILESPYTFDQVREIDKYEVFPVLWSNLARVAGEWAGFDEEWLINGIVNSLHKRSAWGNLVVRCSYWIFGWMCKDYWETLKALIGNRSQI